MTIELLSKQGHKNFTDISAEALRLMANFRQHSETWKILALEQISNQGGAYPLPQAIKDILRLLTTEARLRGISLQNGKWEGSLVCPHRGALLQDLFANTLSAFDKAEELGVSEITVNIDSGRDSNDPQSKTVVAWHVGNTDKLTYEPRDQADQSYGFDR